MAGEQQSLPEWLDHYLRVPCWVVYSDGREERILWVNERLALDMKHEREWFVGRQGTEIWVDSQNRRVGQRALRERRSIDVIGDGRDLHGNWRWLDARVTPVDDRHLLVICQDITARIKLAGLRLILGRSFAGSSPGEINEAFARQLLEGASLGEICSAQGLEPATVLARLGRLVGDQEETAKGLLLPPRVEPQHDVATGVPEWVSFYWDLPGPVVLVDYPAMTALWVNRQVLERNRMRMDEVVGRDARTLWEKIPEWMAVIERSMRQQVSLDAVYQGENLRGEQQWMAVRTTPIGSDRLMILSEDITADIRLQALRLLLNLQTDPCEGTSPIPAGVDEAFARLLLDGASVANIAVALELSAEDVRGRAALLLGRCAGQGLRT